MKSIQAISISTLQHIGNFFLPGFLDNVCVSIERGYDFGAVSYTHLDVYKRQCKYIHHIGCVCSCPEDKGQRRSG